MSCKGRRELLASRRWNFYAQEQSVHDEEASDVFPGHQHHGGNASSTSAPGVVKKVQASGNSSAPDDERRSPKRSQLCGEFVNVLSLREPLGHMTSLTHELQLAYTRHLSRHRRELRAVWVAAPGRLAVVCLAAWLASAWSCKQPGREAPHCHLQPG
jgi:hypothetical protein